jgi:O-antigen ligase
MISACDALVRWGLVGLIAFTPLAFGTVEPWSIALMEWSIVTLFLVFELARFWRPDPSSPKTPAATGLGLPVAAFIVLCVLQTVPLPRSLVGRISPGTLRVERAPNLRDLLQREHPGDAAQSADPGLLDLPAPALRSISIRPDKTWERLRLLGALALLFRIALGWAHRGDRVVFLLVSIVVTGTVIAIEGLVQLLTWNGKIYWFRNVPPSSPFGPFVNHNHYAGYVEMVIPIAIALTFLLAGSHDAASRRALAARSRPSLTTLPGIVRPEDGRWGKGGLALFGCVLLVATLILSLSRGGMLSTLIGGMTLFGILVRRVASRRLAVGIGLGLPLLAVGLILWVGAQAVSAQIESYASLEREASFRSRVEVWKAIGRGIPDFLWVGAGLGTFEESFKPWAPPGSANRWDRAHNDYLQLLWETGIAGCALFTLGVVRYFQRFWRPAFGHRADPLDLPSVAIAVSLLTIALHSVVDFNLQIGSNAFLCTLLAALLVSARRIADAGRREAPVLVPVGVERAAVPEAAPR